ncbi:hypothetical protein L6164_033496 [Bauhinia variegata]|uniref:Uncharacterized protein n=1 Tax=Bauhinia variegata TaxID=167791 RepID=A0ACB9KRU3_BAUVA|nr:hypothetical protein L6164_033496 [Bauhinia variegata]
MKMHGAVPAQNAEDPRPWRLSLNWHMWSEREVSGGYGDGGRCGSQSNTIEKSSCILRAIVLTFPTKK